MSNIKEGNMQAMLAQYEEYLKKHIDNVQKGYQWLWENLEREVIYANFYNEKFYGTLVGNIMAHDESKRSAFEYKQYAAHFYGERTAEVEKAFKYAWNHHKHTNPHHWDYWTILKDDGTTEALEMPLVYVLEMICDWWAFSWSAGNLYEIFDWYEKNKATIILHPNTKKYLEKVLQEIKEILDKTVDN